MGVKFNNPNKKNYDDSSAGFNSYMEKLNRQHPDKEFDFGDSYNYGMKSSVHAMRGQYKQKLHEQLDNVKQERNRQMREIREEQKRMRRGKPEGFI